MRCIWAPVGVEVSESKVRNPRIDVHGNGGISLRFHHRPVTVLYDQLICGSVKLSEKAVESTALHHDQVTQRLPRRNDGFHVCWNRLVE